MKVQTNDTVTDKQQLVQNDLRPNRFSS